MKSNPKYYRTGRHGWTKTVDVTAAVSRSKFSAGPECDEFKTDVVLYLAAEHGRFRVFLSAEEARWLSGALMQHADNEKQS